MTLLDWIVPRKASEWGRLTRPWPALDLWRRANPALNDRVLPEAMWAAAADPHLPPGVVEIDGHRHPLVEFMEKEPPTTWTDPENHWLGWGRESTE